jgi:hypothetical protein
MDHSNALLTFAGQMPAVQQAVLMIGYLIGFIMAGVGLFTIATGGGSNKNPYMSHGVGLGFSALLVGALMLNLWTTVMVLTGSVYGAGTEPLNALSRVENYDNPMHTWIAALFDVLIVIGWVVAVWGLVNLGIAGSRREKGLSAGLSRLATAVFLTNPYAFVTLMGGTFGMGQTVRLLLPGA